MAKPSNLPTNSSLTSFVSQDNISGFTGQTSLSSSSSPKKLAGRPRGRKKIVDSDPFADLNYNSERAFSDERYETKTSKSKSLKSEDEDDVTDDYNGGYNDTDDDSSYESFRRG